MAHDVDLKYNRISVYAVSETHVLTMIVKTIMYRSGFQTYKRKVCRVWRGKVEIRLVLKIEKTYADIPSVMIRINIKNETKSSPLQVLLDFRDTLGTCGLPPPGIVF